MSDHVRDLAKLLEEAGAEIKFGLRQQGKFDVVVSMRDAGKSWPDVGTAIGWSADAARDMFAIEVVPELLALRAANLRLTTEKEQAQARADDWERKCENWIGKDVMDMNREQSKMIAAAESVERALRTRNRDLEATVVRLTEDKALVQTERDQAYETRNAAQTAATREVERRRSAESRADQLQCDLDFVYRDKARVAAEAVADIHGLKAANQRLTEDRDAAHALADERAEQMTVLAQQINQRMAERDALQAEVARLTQAQAMLRNALVGLVGASTHEELKQLELVLRSMPAPAEDKAVSIDAIHALLATSAAGSTPQESL